MSTKLSLSEINKHLEKKGLSEDAKKALEQKKNIISNDKIVKK